MPATLPTRWVLEVQEGGSGSTNWVPLALYDNVSQMIMEAPTGGGTQFTPQYGRDYAEGAQLVPVGVAESGQPAPYTFNLNFPLDARPARNLIKQMMGKKNLRARNFGGDMTDPINYKKMLYYVNSRNTDKGYSRNIIDNTTNPGDVLNRKLGQYALFEVEVDKVQHLKISGTVTTLALNDIIRTGYKVAASGAQGETLNRTGDEEFAIGTDKSAGGAAPSILFTLDGGSTWTARVLTGQNDVDIIGIVKAGPNLVFCSNSVVAGAGGIRYVNYQNLKDNSFTVVTATGIGTSVVVNDIIAVSASVLYACANAGAVYKSTDGGMSWAPVGTAVTANNLLAADYADENLIWFGGASSTLVKLYNGVMSLVTVTGLASTINTLAVPRGPFGRELELYVGSAAGNIHRTLDGLAAVPSWTTMSFDQAGSGAIEEIKFVRPDGLIMYVIQTNGSSQSRILRDMSGGKLGPDVDVLGGFTSPANSTINAIAPSSENYALCVGEVNTSQGFIGQVA